MAEGKLTPLTTSTLLTRQSHVITSTISPHIPHLIKIAPGVTSPLELGFPTRFLPKSKNQGGGSKPKNRLLAACKPGFSVLNFDVQMSNYATIIIIITTMFMVLSSWQSHCESSPGSFDECRTAPSGRRPKTKPDDLCCESHCTGCQKLHPPSPFIITLIITCIVSPRSRLYFKVCKSYCNKRSLYGNFFSDITNFVALF